MGAADGELSACGVSLLVGFDMRLIEFLSHPFTVMIGTLSGMFVITGIGWVVTRKNMVAHQNDLRCKVDKEACSQAMDDVKLQIKDKVGGAVCSSVQEAFNSKLKDGGKRFERIEDRLSGIERSNRKQLAALAFLVGKAEGGDPRALGLEG